MSPRPPEPGYHREILARFGREQERHQDEDDPSPPGAEAAAFAQARAGGKVPAEAVEAILPASGAPLVPADPARREAFARNLAELASRAAAPEAADLPLDALTAQACAACRGSCCRWGGDHAFLTEETLAGRGDGRSVAEVVDAYLAFLPAETVQDSCIYHGAAGCGLPREWRSTTCNRHLCGKLEALRARLPAQNPPPVLVVLVDGGRRLRTALLDAAGLRILSEESPPAGLRS